MISETVALALIGIISMLGGVVVWLIKLNAERAAKAQNALTETLNQTIANQRDQISTYGSGFAQLAATMQEGFRSQSEGRKETFEALKSIDAQVMKSLEHHTSALDQICAALVTRSQGK